MRTYKFDGRDCNHSAVLHRVLYPDAPFSGIVKKEKKRKEKVGNWTLKTQAIVIL
jgi:hypothetical protein